MMPRRIFILKKEKVLRDWRKFHYEELHKFYPSQNVIGVTKIKEYERTEDHVAHMGDIRSESKYFGHKT
jgi:hypothetical protein